MDLDPSDPQYGIHRLFIANLIPVGVGGDISELSNPANSIGKIDVGSNFPTIYAQVNSYTDTQSFTYGKVVAIEQQGITATIWVEDAVGVFSNNMTVKSDYGWGGAVTNARTLEGRVERYFKDLTVAHLTSQSAMVSILPILLVTCSCLLTVSFNHLAVTHLTLHSPTRFNSRAPEIGSEFIGYYVGKLCQLDDIVEFDSLRSSFNLKVSSTH